MIRDLVYNFLGRKLQKKKYEVIRLRWEKMRLEKELEKLKSQNQTD